MTTILILAVIGIVLWVVWVAVRDRLVLQIGLRNVPRRHLRGILVVIGLMLSTTIIGSAIGTGESMRYTVRAVITESLGTVDEMVVATGTPRQDRLDRLRSLTEPGISSLASAGLPYFSETDARNAASDADDGHIERVTPAIAEQVSVVNPREQRLTSSVLILAIPIEAQASLSDLGPDDVVLNEAAAEELDATPGESLSLLPPVGSWSGAEPDEPWDVRVATVIENGGIAGAQPTILLSLPRLQERLERTDLVNALLVTNRGGVGSVDRTDAALEDLRVALVNRDVATRIHEILRSPEALQGLAAAVETLEADDRERVIALRAEAERDEMSDRFISLVSDPRVRGGLYFLVRDYLRGEDQREAFVLLRNVSNLTVLPVKQQGIEQADRYGEVVTIVFLVLGVFSVAASMLLIVLTFSLLAADRASELATMRAMGMRDRQVMRVFLTEGLAYAVGGAMLGALAGVGAAWATSLALARALEPFGFEFRPYVDLAATAVSLLAGIVITFSAMVVAAWRVSRSGIVGATKGEPTSGGGAWIGALGGIALLMAGCTWLMWGDSSSAFTPRHPLLVPIVLSLIIIGAWMLALGIPGPRQHLANIIGPTAGVAISIVWLRAIEGLGNTRNPLRDEAMVVAVGGLAVLLGVCWTAVRALPIFLRLVDQMLTSFGRLRATIRPAAGQLSWQRWRTGLVVMMFGMVVFIMAASLTMIDALLDAYSDSEAPVAGFELRAEVHGGTEQFDLPARLADAEAVSPADFDAIGGVRTLETQMVQLNTDVAGWRSAPLALLDEGFLDAAQVRLMRRSADFDDDHAVWSALASNPGTAIVSPAILRSVLVSSSQPDESHFDPITVWVRPADSSGTSGGPMRLTVVGVIDARSELPPAIYTSSAAVRSMDATIEPPDAWYLSVAPESDLSAVEEGLEVSFDEQGMVVTDLGDTLRIGQSVRTLLTRLVQGFMGLGLVAGVAALGLIGVQGVIERRRELGTLRAMGLTSRQVSGSLAFESLVVAVLGIGLGILLGLFFARSLITLLATPYPEIGYRVPWDQILITAGIAWIGATVSIAVAAWQASRVSPAEALRSVS